MSTHILDDDALFTTFNLYRSAPLGEQELDGFILLGGGNGRANAGGINSHTFAEDGDTSFLERHPICVCPSSVRMERQWQMCWHIPLPFRSLSITLAITATSQQKTKREYCTHSNTVAVCVEFAFRCLL
jgi:hypothetical protein